MAQSPNTVETPNFTGVINQQFFIEPLGGPQHPVSYLDSFPEAIYNKSLNSNLLALLYALLGPAGIGTLRKDFLLARLAFEDAGISTTELDNFYANPLGFTRLLSETYETNVEGLLTNAQWSQIQESDASYHNRAVDWVNALRAGGTLKGMTLAAKSGLAHPVEIIENYRALWDRYSDNPLGLPLLGVTKSTEEIIVLPRQDRPENEIQVITSEEPRSGKWALALPIGSGGKQETAEEEAEVNHSRTIEMEYNITAFELQQALENVYVIGKGNVYVSGGPLGVNPYVITFVKALAEEPLPRFLIVKNTLENIESKPVYPGVEISQAGASVDGETAAIPPENWHYASVALDRLKPMTTIPTPGIAPSVTKRQVAGTLFSDSEFVEVIRYVTGKREIAWPAVDSTHWIVPGVEKEAPVTQHGGGGAYLNFHNIGAIESYTDGALLDPHYETSSWPESKYLYHDEHSGAFSSYQSALFPFLSSYAGRELLAGNAVALPAELVTAQDSSNGTALINGIYPTDYSALAGVEQIPSAANIWASSERSEGSDYLEIDLGTVQAINFISFEISGKPVNIDFSYDVIDQGPARRFIPAATPSVQGGESTIGVGYNASASNPWTTVNVGLETSLGGMIFTRYLRIGLTRRTGTGSPFTLNNGENIPFSIEVQHLRVGRNVAA